MTAGRVRTLRSRQSDSFVPSSIRQGRLEAARQAGALEAARVASGGSEACLYSAEGRLLRLLAHSTASADRPHEFVEITSDHPLNDWLEGAVDGEDTASYSSGDMTWVPLGPAPHSSVLSLRRPTAGIDGIRGLARLLSTALYGEGTVAGDGILPSSLERFAAMHHAGSRLGDMAAVLKESCSLASIQLYCGAGDGVQPDFEVGDAVPARKEDIAQARQTGIPSTRLRRDEQRNIMMARVLVPVDGRKDDRIVALYELEADREDIAQVEETVSISLRIALGVSEEQALVSRAWAEVICLADRSAADASRVVDASTQLIIATVLESLRDRRFISGYGVRSEESLKTDGHGTAAAEEGSDRKLEALMRRCISRSETVIDRAEGVIVFPVTDDEDRRWAVSVTMRARPHIRSEMVLWEQFGPAFGTLVRSSVLKAKNRRQISEIRRLRSGASTFLNVIAAIENADGMKRLIGSCADGLSAMTQCASFGFIREGESYRLISPEVMSLSIPRERMSSILAGSKELARYVHQVSFDNAGVELGDLTGGETDDMLYMMPVLSRRGDMTGAVFCPAQEGYFLRRTREDTLSAVMSMTNLRASGMEWADEASTERSKNRKVEEVISRISLAEGDSSIVSSIVEAASDLTGSDIAALAIMDVEKNQLVSGSTTGIEVAQEHLQDWLGSGVSGRILRTLEPEIVNDYGSDPDMMEDALHRLKFKRITGVPVRIDMKHRGVLIAVKTKGGAYTGEDLKTLELLSNMASYAIRASNARIERRRLVDDFDSLQSAELKLYSSRTFEELIAMLGNEVKSLFHASAVLIATDVNNVKRIMYSTAQEIEEGDVVYNSGPIGLQFDEVQHSARVVERASLEEEWSRTLETNELLLVKAGFQTEAIVIAAVNGASAPKFGADDIEKLGKLSKIASTALDKTRLLSGINQKLKHIEIVHTIIDALVYGKKDYEIFDSVLPTLVDMCGADLGLLWKYDRKNEKLKISAEHYRNRETEHLVGYEVSSKKGIVGSVVSNKMPVLIANAAIDNKAVHISGTNMEKFESVLGVPLIVRRELLGVLMIYRDNPPPFTSVELDVLTSVANDISLVMAKHSREAGISAGGSSAGGAEEQ